MTCSAVLDKRRAGILLHPTSLPGPADHGDMGHQAYRFIEFLQASRLTVWQTLPLGPTHEDNSPYQCLSVHAGNRLLISLDWLADRGLLEKELLIGQTYCESHRNHCLNRAFQNFATKKKDFARAYKTFLDTHAYWLEDYALFMTIREKQNNLGWMHWPADLRERKQSAMKHIRTHYQDRIDYIYFEQFVFFQQWHELKQYANDRNIRLFGDMPIFVAHDSAEVWAHREFFCVDNEGKAIRVAGVPPDYFSENGQRWGNPLYAWNRIRKDKFSWWVKRMQTQLAMFDMVRIDHFRGFESNWEIPADEPTAINGRWVKTPGYELLNVLYEKFRPLPVIAEDLGIITQEVEKLRKAFNIPGMKVLQFAFTNDADNPYLPHNHEKNCVVYTGTHDNNTTLAWFNSLPESTRVYIQDYLHNSTEKMPWSLIRSAMASVARLCIIPMQDILELADGNRMNIPGTRDNNWQWRFDWSQVSGDLSKRLYHLAKLYER